MTALREDDIIYERNTMRWQCDMVVFLTVPFDDMIKVTVQCDSIKVTVRIRWHLGILQMLGVAEGAVARIRVISAGHASCTLCSELAC